MRSLPSLTSFLLFTALCSTAIADKGLSFVKNRIEVTVKPDAKMVSIPFAFENKSNRTITIARYDSSCSCVSARVAEPLGKMIYKPGEKGTIVIDFELGSFSGQVEKPLLLWTTDDAAETPSSVLTSAITIPVLFEITPTTLFWDQNGSKEPKTIKLKVHNDKPIQILSHMGSNNNYPYELKTIRDGWEYEIIVTPESVASMGMGLIKLTTDAPIARYQRQQAFVCVRRPVAKPTKPIKPIKPQAK